MTHIIVMMCADVDDRGIGIYHNTLFIFPFSEVTGDLRGARTLG